MILEIADITIDPDRQQEFQAAIRRGLETVVSDAKGCRGRKVNHGVERP